MINTLTLKWIIQVINKSISYDYFALKEEHPELYNALHSAKSDLIGNGIKIQFSGKNDFKVLNYYKTSWGFTALLDELHHSTYYFITSRVLKNARDSIEKKGAPHYLRTIYGANQLSLACCEYSLFESNEIKDSQIAQDKDSIFKLFPKCSFEDIEFIKNSKNYLIVYDCVRDHLTCLKCILLNKYFELVEQVDLRKYIVWDNSSKLEPVKSDVVAPTGVLPENKEDSLDDEVLLTIKPEAQKVQKKGNV